MSRAHPLLVLVALLVAAMFAVLALPLSLWRAFWDQVRQ